MQLNPVEAVDLPLRPRADEDSATGTSQLITNSFDFVRQRHSLPDNEQIRSRYEAAINNVTEDIPNDAIASFQLTRSPLWDYSRSTDL